MRDTANSTDLPQTDGLPAPAAPDGADASSPHVAPWLPAAAPGRAPAAPESSARPAPGVAADLAPAGPRRRWVVLAFALSFLIYLALIPRIVIYSSPPTGDQAFYLMVVASIVEDHDLNIANNYAAREEDRFYALAPHPPDFVGMAAPYPLPPLKAFSSARPPTEMYDFRQPGLPLLIAPAYEIGSWFQLWWPATVVFMCLLGALVGANIFLLAYELTGRLGIAWAVWLPLAFSNPIMSYTFLLFTELPTALLVLYAFRRLAQGWQTNGPLRLLVVGLCIGYIPWMSWRCAPVAAGLGLYALVQWWRALRARRGAASAPDPAPRWAVWRRPVGSWAFMLLPLLASGGLLVWFNLFLFGRLTPPDKVPELGDAPPFLWPWESAQAFTNFVTTGFGLLFDRQAGLLPYAPIYVLAIVGILAMFRSGRGADRRLLFWMAVIALPYAALIMAYLLWTGLWGPPARFLTVVTPLLAGPLALSLLALSRTWIYRGIYALLALPGLFLMAIMMRDPRMLWPANSIFAWLAGAPDSWLHIDLLRVLPLFSPIDELTLPGDTGWMTAAIVLIVLVSYLLLMWRGTLRPARPLPYAAHGAIWVVALLLVGSSWWTMNADALKHRTTLVPQRQWTFQPPMAEPLGITYLDGVLYMVDYTGRSVGALDLRTGPIAGIQAVLGPDADSLDAPGRHQGRAGQPAVRAEQRAGAAGAAGHAAGRQGGARDPAERQGGHRDGAGLRAERRHLHRRHARCSGARLSAGRGHATRQLPGQGQRLQ